MTTGRMQSNSEHLSPQAARADEGPKQGSVISASLGAILSSLATIGCCFPLGFAGALGAAGAGAFLQRYRSWFLGLSVVLLAVGFWQQRRATRCSVRRSYLSVVLLWTAVAFVVAMFAFPQEIAGFIADHFSGAAK